MVRPCHRYTGSSEATVQVTNVSQLRGLHLILPEEGIELIDAFFRAETTKRDEEHVEEQLLEGVLLVQTMVADVAANGVEQLPHELIVDVAQEEAFADASADELQKGLIIALAVLSQIILNARIYGYLLVETR